MFTWLKNLFSKSSAPSRPLAGASTATKNVAPQNSARRGPAPLQSTPPSGNPTKGSKFRIAVNGPAGQREENVDLVQVLSGVLRRLGREHTLVDGGAIDTATGIEFRPGFISFQPNDDLSMQMCTTLETRHPAKFSRPFFEYQHSSGATAELSVAKGFEDWGNLDLPVIVDSLKAHMDSCTAIEMQFPNGKTRRVVLGPVMHCASASYGPSPSPDSEESHSPFCPCCMFTNSHVAFQPLLESDGYHAIRLFAARGNDGALQADCRVNGEDHALGKDALIAYVRTWPSTGFEFRKQYVIIQDRPPAADSNSDSRLP